MASSSTFIACTSHTTLFEPQLSWPDMVLWTACGNMFLTNAHVKPFALLTLRNPGKVVRHDGILPAQNAAHLGLPKNRDRSGDSALRKKCKQTHVSNTYVGLSENRIPANPTNDGHVSNVKVTPAFWTSSDCWFAQLLVNIHRFWSLWSLSSQDWWLQSATISYPILIAKSPWLIIIYTAKVPSWWLTPILMVKSPWYHHFTVCSCSLSWRSWSSTLRSSWIQVGKSWEKLGNLKNPSNNCSFHGRF